MFRVDTCLTVTEWQLLSLLICISYHIVDYVLPKLIQLI